MTTNSSIRNRPRYLKPAMVKQGFGAVPQCWIAYISVDDGVYILWPLSGLPLAHKRHHSRVSSSSLINLRAILVKDSIVMHANPVLKSSQYTMSLPLIRVTFLTYVIFCVIQTRMDPGCQNSLNRDGSAQQQRKVCC